MEPFIRSDQFNFIKYQTRHLVSGNATVNDADVLAALKSLAIEKVLGLFPDITDEQKQLLLPVQDIKEKAEAADFLSHLKEYVIPFWHVTDLTVRKLFPKAKKLKLPPLDEIDLKELSYLGWDDKGSNKKFLIVPYKNKLTGLQGTFTSINKKGICSLCNGLEETGMFTTEIKGDVQGTFVKRGNYICQDSLKCNENMKSLDKLEEFITRLK
ncbi:FusB/FusC family EF-G-binding protein [Metabacillus sp. RGM 3146]|uniref:FusB/FusC family EF-G-binding protein n=1 Tax=Metabacillus sp. RGM 3146 TaxID=3401092 RepID=UPI003B9C1D6B